MAHKQHLLSFLFHNAPIITLQSFKNTRHPNETTNLDLRFTNWLNVPAWSISSIVLQTNHYLAGSFFCFVCLLVLFNKNNPGLTQLKEKTDKPLSPPLRKYHANLSWITFVVFCFGPWSRGSTHTFLWPQERFQKITDKPRFTDTLLIRTPRFHRTMFFVVGETPYSSSKFNPLNRYIRPLIRTINGHLLLAQSTDSHKKRTLH